MMKVEQYLRTVVNSKVRPLFIKDECEVCGKKDDLHFHHVTKFSELLSDTLNELNLENKDTDDYTELEMNLIINVMLGKHLLIKYLTVCSDCHKELHEHEKKGLCVNDKFKQHYQGKRIEKEQARKAYVDTVLIPYLKNNEGVDIIDKEDRKELIDILNYKDYRSRQRRSVKTLNREMEKEGIPFRIEYKRKTVREGNTIGKQSIWKVVSDLNSKNKSS